MNEQLYGAGYYLITWQLPKFSTIPSALERIFCRGHNFYINFFPPTNLRKPDEGERKVLEELYMNVYTLFLSHLCMFTPQARPALCISDTSQISL